MLCRHLVAGFHVKQRQVCVNHLVVRPQFFRLVPLLNRPIKLLQSAERHAERHPGIKVIFIHRKNGLKPTRRRLVVPLTKREGRLVKLFVTRPSSQTLAQAS